MPSQQASTLSASRWPPPQRRGAAHGKRPVAPAIADRGAAVALQLQLAVRPVGQAMLQAERWRGSPGAHGAQPGHRCDSPDRREQEGGVPYSQGTESGGVRQAFQLQEVRPRRRLARCRWGRQIQFRLRSWLRLQQIRPVVSDIADFLVDQPHPQHILRRGPHLQRHRPHLRIDASA